MRVDCARVRGKSAGWLAFRSEMPCACARAAEPALPTPPWGGVVDLFCMYRYGEPIQSRYNSCGCSVARRVIGEEVSVCLRRVQNDHNPS